MMQEKGNKCNPFQLKDEGVEVKGKTGPVKSSRERYMSCDACNADSRRGAGPEGGGLKSSRIKTNSSFTLVQKRHLVFLFFIFSFFNKQACRTKGEVNIFGGEGEGILKAQKTTCNIGWWWRRD